jgi:hypothetical protein
MAEAETKPAPAQIDPEIIAVIAAAVNAVIDTPFEIIDVSERRPDGSVVSRWAIAGRSQILYSHNLR